MIASRIFAQVEAGFPRSKLVDRAMTSLGLDRDQAIGKFVRLWLAMLQCGPGGSLADRSDDWIEEEVGWRGMRGAFAAFVRQYHLDERGVIRDWDEKYGKLDRLREQARDRKRRQRDRERDEVGDEVGDSHRDIVPSRVTGDVTREVTDGVTAGVKRRERSLTSPVSLSPVSASHTATGQEREVRHADLRALFDTALGVGWLEQPALVALSEEMSGFIRAARAPLAVAQTIASHLPGGAGTPTARPEIVATALREMAAAGERFNARYFAGFVRRAIGGRALQREAQHEAAVQDDERAVVRDVRSAEKAVQVWAEANPDTYARIEAAAREQFPGEGAYVTATRAAAVFAEARAQMGRERTTGGGK